MIITTSRINGFLSQPTSISAGTRASACLVGTTTKRHILFRTILIRFIVSQPIEVLIPLKLKAILVS